MALVAIDNLAEVLLFRHMQLAQEIGGESWANDVPRLGKRGQERFRRDFKFRVRLAQKGSDDLIIERIFRSLLSRADASIFRVAHTYRNRVYHADHHNSTILPLIAGAYLKAVGRAFVASQPTGIESLGDPFSGDLAKYGYCPKREGAFAPEEAAIQIVEHLSDGLSVSLKEAKKELIADLVWRTEWAEQMTTELERQGLSRDRIEHGIAWSEFWEKVAGRNDEVAKLANDEARLWRTTVRGEGETIEDRFQAGQKRSDLVFGMWREFTPTLSLAEIPQLRRLSAKLSSAKSSEALFSRYRILDEETEVLERYLGELAIGWDKHIQEEEERARGN